MEKYAKKTEQQSWLGAYTTKQLQDTQMPTTAHHILRKWKNIRLLDLSITSYYKSTTFRRVTIKNHGTNKNHPPQ